MANTQPGKMEAACQEIFHESAETCVPRLIEEYRTPVRVAPLLGVVPNTVRVWLERRGWLFDGEKWVHVEPEHAI